ncbi:pilus assembly PilX N-terminal domain-containing protein [Synechococcus sp. PCC 6717]|nr:pilus assembly PilX N-terminal domain-containing protein [Synechococcus sp. PCC 6717]
MTIKKLLRTLSRRLMHPPTGHRRRYRQRGFTLPLVLGMGLIMMVVALTLISRSQLDVSTASLQKQTQQAFAVAEGGMARTLGLLNGNYQILLRRTYNPVNPNTGRRYLIDRAVDPSKVGQPNVGQPNTDPRQRNTDGIDATPVDEWNAASLGDAVPPCFTLNNVTDILLNGQIGNPVQGNYRILAYLYDQPTETGHLLIEGRLANNSPANAYVLQKMKITDRNVPANFPGLLAQRINLGNNDVFGAVNGNVICTNANNCKVPADQCVNGQPTNAGLRQAVGALNNSIIHGTIAVNKIELPPFPTPPPTVNPSGNPPVNEGAYNLGDIGEMTLPRPNDRPYVDTSLPAEDPDRIYYAYRVNNIDLKGNNNLTINTSRWPVRLFVSGNISLKGQAGIRNICSPPDSDTCSKGAKMELPPGIGTPDRLRIYGNPPDPNNAVTDQQFTLSGGSTAGSLFVYAPDAKVGINGGSSSPDIVGAVWAKEWNGSSSNNAEIYVPDSLPEDLGEAYQNSSIVVARTTEASNWNRLAQY